MRDTENTSRFHTAPLSPADELSLAGHLITIENGLTNPDARSGLRGLMDDDRAMHGLASVMQGAGGGMWHDPGQIGTLESYLADPAMLAEVRGLLHGAAEGPSRFLAAASSPATAPEEPKIALSPGLAAPAP